MRMSLRLTFWLYVMDAAQWAYRHGARAAAYSQSWVLPLWLAVMDSAYWLYVRALRKTLNARNWK